MAGSALFESMLREHRLSYLKSVVRYTDEGTVAKLGSCVTPSEFHALEFVSASRCVPCPKPLSLETHGGISMITMTRCVGAPLHELMDTMAPGAVDDVLCEVEACMRSLRSFAQRSGASGADGLAVGDFGLTCAPTMPRFDDLQHPATDVWHAARAMSDRTMASDSARLIHMTAMRVLMRTGVSRICHMDLNPSNIMVGPDGRLSGIVDWERCGWYPVPCEAVMALISSRLFPRYVESMLRSWDVEHLDYMTSLALEFVMNHRDIPPQKRRPRHEFGCPDPRHPSTPALDAQEMKEAQGARGAPEVPAPA